VTRTNTGSTSGSSPAEALADASGAGLDEAGRVSVGAELTLAGHPEVFALGDMARVHDAHGHAVPLPGVAPVAMQQGRYAAKAIRARLKGREPRAFRYLDKGNVATIGRLKAVADVRGLRLSGTLAWLTWLFVHLYYLVGLQNRVLVFIRWAVSFLTRGRGARLITGEPAAGAATPRAAVTARAA
jgi:NADH dehydrogenase